MNLMHILHKALLRGSKIVYGSGMDEDTDMSGGVDAEKARRQAILEAEQERRKQRLAQQLRANLQRRKAQVRARRDGEADQRVEGLPVVSDTENGNDLSGGDNHESSAAQSDP